MSGHLLRKAVRDLTRSAAQFAAAGVVVMLGVGVYLGMMSAYLNLSASYGAYYERCHFADFHAELDFGTDRLADRVRRIPGVIAVHGRLVTDVPLERPGSKHQRISLRVVSLPDGANERVNDVLVLAGRAPAHGRREILFEKRFAEYHGYRVGNRARLLVDGEERDYRIVGLAVSPEYIYPIATKEYLLPSPSTFGIAFVRRDQAEEILEAWGLVNDLAVTCEPARRAAIMAQVERMLQPYGSKAPEPREDQPSYYMLNADLEGYEPMAVFFPAFLLFAAALTLYTVLRRLVESQRAVIGFLRASGFTRGQVVAHYTIFPVLLGLASGAAGIVLGQGLAIGITQMYLAALNIPLLAAPMHWDVAVTALLLGTGACLLGGVGPALGSARLAPAEALRDAPGAPGRRLAVERLIPALARAGALMKMPVRNLARRPGRTLWAVLGIAAASALIIISGSWRDAVDDMMVTYFGLMHRYDLEVGFQEPQTDHQAFRVGCWPGVWRAEGMLGVPVEVRKGDRSVQTAVVGLPGDARLLDLRGLARDRLPLQRGVVLASRLLRQKLGAQTGDTVTIAYAFQSRYRRGEMKATVGPPLRLPVGQNLYMNIADVRQAFRDALDLPPGAINSVIVKTKTEATDWVHARCYDLPLAGAVSSTAETKRDLDEQLGMMNAFIGVMVLFGMMLALSVVYATVSVTVLERRRELAALRAEGASRGRITALVTFENLLVWALGCAAGLPAGVKVALVMLSVYVTDVMELAPVVFPRTLLLAAGATLAAVVLSQWPALRYVHRLNIADILRFRE